MNTAGSLLPATARARMTELHTDVQQVGRIAEEAFARTPVLSHVIDFSAADGQLDEQRWTKWASDGYGGQVIVGSDLQAIHVA